MTTPKGLNGTSVKSPALKSPTVHRIQRSGKPSDHLEGGGAGRGGAPISNTLLDERAEEITDLKAKLAIETRRYDVGGWSPVSVTHGACEHTMHAPITMHALCLATMQ